MVHFLTAFFLCALINLSLFLGRHPTLRAEAKRTGTAVEVCPLSNQVLKLVDDLRNHPVHGMLAEGLPVVVSPDDPALWASDKNYPTGILSKPERTTAFRGPLRGCATAYPVTGVLCTTSNGPLGSVASCFCRQC